MNDFFNPKSMTTPGMAGGLVMMLANALCYQFPELTPRWVGLALSFVIGGYVVAKAIRGSRARVSGSSTRSSSSPWRWDRHV